MRGKMIDQDNGGTVPFLVAPKHRLRVKIEI